MHSKCITTIYNYNSKRKKNRNKNSHYNQGNKGGIKTLHLYFIKKINILFAK